MQRPWNFAPEPRRWLPDAPALLSSLLLVLAAGPAGALPLLSEVFYDAVGADNGHVFVEIHGVPGTSLDGFSIEGVNGSNGAVGPVLLLSGAIPSDGLFVVADDVGDGTTFVAGADLILDFGPSPDRAGAAGTAPPRAQSPGRCISPRDPAE